MKKALVIVLFLITRWTGAQNWVPVPCFNTNSKIHTAIFDSLHNSIILNFQYENTLCNKEFKGILAYDGTSFQDLDFGIDLHDYINPNSAGKLLASTRYNNKTLFGGYFKSVGSNTLFANGIALWNNVKWDTFPKFTFAHNLDDNSPPAIHGFLKDSGKLWIYGTFDSLGGIPGKNLYSFDGTTFVPYTIPVSDYDNVHRLIKYKNKLIASGFFYDYPSYSISKLAMFDGTTWSSVDNGVKGGLAGVGDMIIYKDTLYIGGSFSKADGNKGNYVMKWDGTQLRDAGFGNYYGWGSINQFVVFRNRLYAFGIFLHAANQKAFNVAYYENGKWTVPQDSIDNTIQNAIVLNNELYIAGAFMSINGDPNLRYFAKLQCPDFDAASSCLSSIKENSSELELRVYPNPVKNKFKIETDLNKIKSICLSDILGQIVYSSSVISNEIDISRFSNGLYFLTFQTYNEKKVVKIIKE